MTMISFMLNFSFWFEFEMQQKSRFEKALGKTAIGAQHLRIHPSAIGASEE